MTDQPPHDGEGKRMEASVEARLQFLEERVKTLEAIVSAGPAPARAAPPKPVEPAATRAAPWPSAPQVSDRAGEAAETAPPRAPFDIEELLGGRVLAWVGGIAVVLAAVFFLVMAVHNGWIDEPTRVVLAFLGSTALLGAGVWLYEAKGRTQAALATVAAALAALYASDTAATAVYHLVSSPVGLVLAGLIGAAAMLIAIRWDSPVVAGIGLVGGLLSPVLVDAGTTAASLRSLPGGPVPPAGAPSCGAGGGPPPIPSAWARPRAAGGGA